MENKIILGYWPIRGFGQIPRLLLAYSGLEFEEKRYTDWKEWFEKDKQGLGFDFPNLPYITDGDFKTSESQAIMRYIILKSNKLDLIGKDLKDETIVRELEGVFQDAYFGNKIHAS